MKKLLFISIYLFCLTTAKSEEPVITMTTSKAVGSEITLSIRANVHNTIVRIDFGDGNLIERTVAKTNGYSSDIVGTVKGSQIIKIYGPEITQLTCSSNGLTTLDITKCPSLIELWCEYNQIKQLDVSKNSALKVLGCTKNQLTSLDLSNHTALQMINCDENNISKLTLNNNPALNEIRCSFNQLTFATLPIKQSTWTFYDFDIQNKMVIPKMNNIGTPLDLSDQYSIDGKLTKYEWLKKNGITLVENVDYSISSGKTTFLKIPEDSVWCYMTNASFPDLRLGTTFIKVTKKAQTIKFDAIPGKKANDAAFTLAASATSGYDISFTSSDPSIASIIGNTVTIKKAGTVTIKANQAGNGIWEAAPEVTQTLNISKQPQTITFSALPAKKANDAAFPLSASASSGLDVTFTSSDESIASISGNTVTIKKAGTVSIKANQSGNDTYESAPEVTQTLTISKISQTITFSALPAKKTNDAAFALSASTSSGLDVTFTSSDASIASINGNTVTIKKAGMVTIKANQAGNGIWEAAPEVIQTLTISKQTQTITFNALPAKNVNDAAFSLSASANSGLAVTFTSSDPSIASVSESTVTIKKAGTVTITANQTGNESWEAAPEVSQTLVITRKQNQTITFDPLPAKKVNDAPFELTAKVDSNLPLTFTSSDPAIASISGTKVTLHKAGMVTITAVQAGNDTYEAAIAEQELTITTVTGINEEKESQLKVYPNPVTDILYIKGETAENAFVSIFNLSGVKVWSGVINQQSVNVSGLPSGFYIMKINNKEKKERFIRFNKQ